MAADVDPFDLLLRGTSPKNKHDGLAFLVNAANHRIGEFLPALASMRTGLVSPHRQHGVQQQDTSVRPGRQVAVVGNRAAQIVVQFVKDVHQRRWR